MGSNTVVKQSMTQDTKTISTSVAISAGGGDSEFIVHGKYYWRKGNLIELVIYCFEPSEISGSRNGSVAFRLTSAEGDQRLLFGSSIDWRVPDHKDVPCVSVCTLTNGLAVVRGIMKNAITMRETETEVSCMV